MALITHKTVLKTATVASVKLTAPADRIGLGFAALAYPADSLSQGRFPTPHNPVPEQVRSRQEQSEVQTRMRLQPGGPGAVPPAGSAGCLRSPGSTAVSVAWSSAARNTWPTASTDPSRNRFPKVRVVNVRLGRDCQSPDRTDDRKATLAREVVSLAAAGK
jgi:hypothetical protein